VTLRRELIRAVGEQHASGLRAHPSPAAVAALSIDTLRTLKFSGSKAEYLLTAARAVANGELRLDTMRQLSASHAARLLGAMRGVGPWTVQYAFLRGLGFADCLLAGDAGLAQGLHRMKGYRPDERQIRDLMASYAPHRSLATYHIWTSLKGEPYAN
jgi:3-methyladenine DNA glycosylase/8-oxoguanine DNA glycosylase